MRPWTSRWSCATRWRRASGCCSWATPSKPSAGFAEALTSYQRSAVLHRRLGDRGREALAWQGTGETPRRLGRHAEAAGFHRRAATVQEELGDAWQQAIALDGLAAASLSAAEREGHRHWGDALRLLDGYRDARALRLRTDIEGRLARGR